ncbi:MAG: GTP-binding protein [Collinsella aerofaciens]
MLEYDIETFVYSRRKPFDLQKFTDFVEQEWPDEVISRQGPTVADRRPGHVLHVEQAGHQMRLMENGLFVDSAPEGEKQKIIDEKPEIMQIWDDETGDRMTSLCIIGRHMDKDALIAALDACLTDWHRA